MSESRDHTLIVKLPGGRIQPARFIYECRPLSDGGARVARIIDFDSLPWPPDENALERLTAFLNSTMTSEGTHVIICTHRSMAERGMRISMRDVNLDDRPPFIPPDLSFIALHPVHWALMFIYRALMEIPNFAQHKREGHLRFDWSAVGAVGNAGDGILTIATTSGAQIEHPATI